MRTVALQQTQTQHEMEKNAMYKEHSYDQNLPRTDKTVLCSSFDLQAVLATPRSESVLLFYSRKYATYNLPYMKVCLVEDTALSGGKPKAAEGRTKLPHAYTDTFCLLTVVKLLTLPIL